mmetsp:Transcript_94801/g.165564  ORF Transcript_94801/g.165564 Transcript_94801/m.165564 type:complete len:1108 (-) Transcript_94801:121-3444(-)
MQSDTATRRAIRHAGVWVELERCKDCRAHAYCTSHQEEKYDRYEKMVTAALRGKCPVEVNPGPRAAGVRLRQVKYNPILFQAQRPRSKDCEDCHVETLRYPRLGAFELWVCYGARREEAFSKLKCQRWPNKEQVLERMEELADRFGGWNSTDVDAGILPPTLPTPAPAPAALLADLHLTSPSGVKKGSSAATSSQSLVAAAAPASSLEESSLTSAPAPAAASSLPKAPRRQRSTGQGGKQLLTHAELCKRIKGKYDTVMASWRSFDRNCDGTVVREEFDRGMRMSGVDLPQEQLDELWQLADVDGSGSVCYQEFAQQLCGWNSGSSSPVTKGFDQTRKWSLSEEDLNKDKMERRPMSLAALARDPRIHKVSLEDLTIDLFRARIISKYGSLMMAFRYADINQDSEVSYEEWVKLLPKVIGDVVPIDVCNLLWHQLDADKSGIVSFAEFFTKKLVDPHPEQALRQLECFGDGPPVSPTSSASRPTSPTTSRPTSPTTSGARHQTALPKPKSPPGSKAPRPKRASASRTGSPSAGSSQRAAAAAEPEAPAKLGSAQKPPLPQDDTQEASSVFQPAYDKKSSVSNFSTVASSTDLRSELREGSYRPLSATSSDVSMPSQLPGLGLSRPASEGLMAPALEEMVALDAATLAAEKTRQEEAAAAAEEHKRKEKAASVEDFAGRYEVVKGWSQGEAVWTIEQDGASLQITSMPAGPYSPCTGTVKGAVIECQFLTSPKAISAKFEGNEGDFKWSDGEHWKRIGGGPAHYAPAPTAEANLVAEAPAAVEDKDEYSECFEASMSHSALAAPQTPGAAAPAAPFESPALGHEAEASGAPLAATAATLLPAEDERGEYSTEFEASASASALQLPRQSQSTPAAEAEASGAPLAATAATLLPAKDEQGEYSTEFEASASASALAGLQAGVAPEARALAASAGPETAAAAHAARPPSAAVGIGAPGAASPAQDMQATLERSEYSGFEASDLGLSAMAAEAPAAVTASAPLSAVADLGAVARAEPQPTSPANLDTDDYSYNFDASLAGGGSLEIRVDNMNADDRPTVTVLDGESEVDDEAPADLGAIGITSGQAGHPHADLDASADSYDDYEGFEESMGN